MTATVVMTSAALSKKKIVLSSSARVSQVTYQTVVGVRYPELVTFNGTNWNFGKFVPHERPQRGGFLPIFWDVPADTHAVEDIGAVVDWLTLDNFSTVVWLGLATCWRRTSERILSVGSLHAPVFCFTRFHQVLGWSSCLALSNQQACVRPCCFTGRPRPLGTGFFNGSMVLSIDLLLPPLRFLPYGFLATGSPRLTAF